MADLVSDGGEFSCNFCTSKLKLSVISSSSEGDSKKLANQTNCFFPPPGGNCTFPPNVPPTPCPGIPPGSVIATGQSTVKIDQQPALGDGCSFMCPKGQMVSLSGAGQAIAKHDEASGAAQALSLVADFIPVVGTVKSLLELATGHDPITGEEVSREMAAIGLIPYGKIAKVAKMAKKAKAGKVTKIKNFSKKAANDSTSLPKNAKNDNALKLSDGKSSPQPQSLKPNSSPKGTRTKNRLPEGRKGDLGPKNGKLEKRNPQTGELQQVRYYNDNGQPVKNIDYGHDHGFGDPHVHDWKYENPGSPNPSRLPGRTLKLGE